MAAILVVTGDTGQGNRIKSALAAERHGVFIVTAEDSLTFSDRALSLIVFDTNGSSTATGLEQFLNEIRGKREIPALALVEESRALEFNRAVDDFLCKPYGESELIARVRRLLARYSRDEDKVIECGGLLINTGNYDVTLDGQKLDLTFKEYQLITLLASNPGKVLTREVILNSVWGYDYFGSDRTVDVHVRRLRSKIEDSRHNFIETVRNVGYRFKKSG